MNCCIQTRRLFFSRECFSMIRMTFQSRYQHSLSDQVELAGGQIKGFSEIPQPKRLPILGTVLDYTKLRNFDSKFFNDFLKKRHENLGNIFKETVLPGVIETTVFCSAPKDVKTIIRSDPKHPCRDGLDFMIESRSREGFHLGLPLLQGEEWYKIRKIVNEHLLSNKSIWRYADQHLQLGYDVAEFIEKNKNKNNEVLNFESVLTNWSLEGTSVFVLDSRCGALTENQDENMQTLIRTTNDLFDIWSRMIMAPPTWKYFDTKDMKLLCKTQREQMHAIDIHREKIQKKINNQKDVSTELESLLNSTQLSVGEKNGLVSDILAAGVETTAIAAMFSIYCLATNPAKQEILRKEIFNLLDSGEPITGKVLQQMKYMHSCNREAQRLYPLQIGVPRRYPKDIVLSGYLIPAGTKVISTANIMNNRDSKYFEDPDNFIPERWLTRARENRFVMPGSFGHGPRMCPGRRFSMQELECLLIALLSRYKIEYHYEPFSLINRLINRPLQKPQFRFLPLE